MQQNNGQSTPAPIFNYRKRPRQAVIAKPFTGPPGPSGAANQQPYPDLMPVGGFQGKGQTQRGRNGPCVTARGASSAGHFGSTGGRQTFSTNSTVQNGQTDFNASMRPDANAHGNAGYRRESGQQSRGRGSAISNPRQSRGAISRGSNMYQNPSSSSSSTNNTYQNSRTPSKSRNQNYKPQGNGNMQLAKIDQYCVPNIGRGSSRVHGQGHSRGGNNCLNYGQNMGTNNGYNFNNQNMNMETDHSYGSNNFSQTWGMYDDAQNDDWDVHRPPGPMSSGGYSNQTGRGSKRTNCQTWNNAPSTAPKRRPAPSATAQYNPTSTNHYNPAVTGRAQNNPGTSNQYSHRASSQYHPMEIDNQWDDDSFQATSVTPQKQQTLKQTNVSPKSLTETEKGLHFLTVDVAGIRRWSKFRDNLQLMFELYGIVDSAVSRSLRDCKEFVLKDEKQQSLNCIFFEIDRQLPKVTRGQWYRVVGTYDSARDRLQCLCIRPVQDGERIIAHRCANISHETMVKATRNLRET